ncbi:MAG: hypothetical protein N4A72_15035 [Bacteroidales bacterium]|jgi:hypothetical protein|nr:hypothetical protein [Bacteroidales bacterium]
MRRVLPIFFVLIACFVSVHATEAKTKSENISDKNCKLSIEYPDKNSLIFNPKVDAKSDYYTLLLTNYKGEVIIERRIKSSSLGKMMNINKLKHGVYSINIIGNRDAFNGTFIR